MSDSDERTERWLARPWPLRLLTATPYARRLMLGAIVCWAWRHRWKLRPDVGGASMCTRCERWKTSRAE